MEDYSKNKKSYGQKAVRNDTMQICDNSRSEEDN